MYRFFVKKDQIQEDAVIIIGSDVNHIKNVLRMKKGETILISDGEDREYVCTIDELENEQGMAHFVEWQRNFQLRLLFFRHCLKGTKWKRLSRR